MIATLSFSLPEEQTEHLDCINGWKWKSVVSQIQENIRAELKYQNPSKEVAEKLEEMRACIFQWMNEENLTLD